MSTVTIHTGDSREILRTLPENSVDAIVTDPPYGLEFMGKDWDAPWKGKASKEFNEIEKGTLGGFTSLPNHSRVNNLRCEECDKWKFSSNPCKCEKPEFPNARLASMQGFQNWCAEWALECLRVLKPGGHLLAFSGSRTYHRMTCAIEDGGFEVRDQMMWVYGSGFPKSLNVGKKMEGWDGWGTALKPAHEPICVARKPLDGTVAENIRKWGVGGMNIDGCRVGTEGATKRKGDSTERESGWTSGHQVEKLNTGRWPANLMHDGSEEVLGLFPGDADSSPARFFYCPKASKRDRDDGLDGFDERRESDREKDDGVGGDNPRNRTNKPRRNIHPTVKPTELMRYLCRLVTPPGGTVLDPFLGSGSTGKAAVLEGFSFVGIDLSAEYAEIAKARIDHALRNK